MTSIGADRGVLTVVALQKLFGHVRAIHDLAFEVRASEIVGLVGPNGAGKTTTLRCISGLVQATSGTIRVAGHDVAEDPVGAKRQLAFVADEPRLFEHLTVWEHLNFFARMYEVAGWEQSARDLLAELDLAGKEDSLPSELSRGMKQKVSIACALLHSPRLVLLDEPLTGIDPVGIRNMKRSLVARARGGAALVLSSHLLALVEEICDRILVIDGGRIVASGTLEEIRRRLAGAAEATFEDLFVRITSGGNAG